MEPSHTNAFLPALGTSNFSEEDLHHYLRDTFMVYLESRESASELPTDTWLSLCNRLSDHVLHFSHPDAADFSWKEKTLLLETTTQLIQSVFALVNDVHKKEHQDYVKRIFCQLLALSFVLGLWIERVVPEEGVTTPDTMRAAVIDAAVAVLMALGSPRSNKPPIEPEDWHEPEHLLRSIVNSWLTQYQTLTLDTDMSVYPRHIKMMDEDGHEPSGERPGDEMKQTIVLSNETEKIVLATAMLEIFLRVLPTSMDMQCCFAAQRRSLIECVKHFCDFSLGPFCKCTNERRGLQLATILRAIPPHHPETKILYRYVQHRVIQARLTGILFQETRHLDDLLRQSFEPESVLATRAVIFQALGRVNEAPADTRDRFLWDLAIFYLQNCAEIAKELHPAVQDRLKVCAEQVPLQPAPKKAHVPSTTPSLTSGPAPRLNIKEHVWRRQIKQLVQEIVAPEPVNWMDDDFRPNEIYTIRRVLGDISDRFSRPLPDGKQEARLSLAENLSKLPCLLVLCSGQNCLSFRKAAGPELVPMYAPVINALLQGDSEYEVTPAVRKAVFKALGVILRHRNEERVDKRTLDIIFKGLRDKDRSTRLSAGCNLEVIASMHDTDTPDSRAASMELFDQLYQVLESSGARAKETMLISIAGLGRTANQIRLGHTLCLLSTQLGSSHILIHSLACTQILSLSKYHKKTPYALIMPHMDQIASWVFIRISTHPALFRELCRLISIAPSDFISINLSRTIPELLVRCDGSSLDFIATQLGKPRHALIVGDNLHSNLAKIFILETQIQTNKVINFVLGILNEASNTKIGLREVLPGCTTLLLTELVVMMGEETPQSLELAISAIRKVESALKTGSSRGSTNTNPSAFLASQMLGIISRIIDMLQDVYGKKSAVAKQKIIRSLGSLITLIGPPIHSVSSQIMATLQTHLSVEELSAVTVESWRKFLITVQPADLGQHIGPTCAAFVSSWPNLSEKSHQIIVESLQHTFNRFGQDLTHHLDEIPDLSVVDNMNPLQVHLSQLRPPPEPKDSLQRILNRCGNSNLTVATLSLGELKRFISDKEREYIQGLASGDVFDPMVGKLLSTLFAAACRDGDGTDNIRLLAYECIGILGAVDPYRFELGVKVADIVVAKNYSDGDETVQFVLHLIQNLLVDTFRSTSDVKYQTHLAYPIQELLKYCEFTSDLVNSGKSVRAKIRNRWNGLSKDVLDVVTPLLEGRFTYVQHSAPNIILPIYPTQSTYREWMQLWVTHLISKASGDHAQKIFKVFLSVVRTKDVVIARHLLPHLVLNILISGDPDDAHDIRTEIITVLEDQVDNQSGSTTDKKLLSAQAIFALLDHLNRWARAIRREISSKRNENKRPRLNQFQTQIEEQLLRLDSILSNLDLNLMAKAAFQCKAFARSLMSFEQQINFLKDHNKDHNLEGYYDTIHEIYAHLDEPDGMEGISTLILSPSLEHQIREHESTGRWTAAQSCWEVHLQHSPDNLEFHQGLLRCLRNLGHCDTLRNHVKGVLTTHPEWQSDLAEFHVESAWMVGAWDDVSQLVALSKKVEAASPAIMIADVLLMMRNDDGSGITAALAAARGKLGAPINAAGVNGYVRSYDAVLNLHVLHELETIYHTVKELPSSTDGTRRKRSLAELSNRLSARLQSVLPTFRNLEPILSMRRIGLSVIPHPRPDLMSEVGSSWLTSAKFARKAGHWQTAYSAMLQGRQYGAPFYFIESARLVKVSGEPLKALHELESYMNSLGLMKNSLAIDPAVDEESANMRAKLHLLRSRWICESERYDVATVLEAFKLATELDKKWESSYFHFGNFYDSRAKELRHQTKDSLKAKEIHVARGLKMNLLTIRNYARAVRYGTKYIYQTVPRLLTLWLDNGEDPVYCGTDQFNKMNDVVASAIRDVPAYKWYSAFPQIASRVGHQTSKVYEQLSTLIVTILQEYPSQALWLFASVVKSNKSIRATRGRAILDKLRSSPSSRATLPRIIADSVAMTNELLSLCDGHAPDNIKVLSMAKSFPQLKALGQSGLVIPLQESLTVNMPSSSSAASTHLPFLPDAPTFKEFADEIEIMKSMAKPRKITIHGSDGQDYTFLGKPKDDLRKDARLMDFNSIINKLLKTNSDARRRQLRIRTYGVVTLNEECGFIQWVPNTIPIRPVLVKAYDARKLKTWGSEMEAICNKLKDMPEHDAGLLFDTKVLPMFPPVFHEWFIETFPEPTAWLESRLNYSRTAAVMSMVGFILGLGDRHCENILLDVNSGDVVHVDFNCLFEKGKALQTPERVPFRLTQNLVDGLGITGVEGVFRISCELTMEVLKGNKDSLMSVLDAFIHDPLVEWEDEKRKMDHRNRKSLTTTINIAKDALNGIKKKFEGYFAPFSHQKNENPMKRLSTKLLVASLIEEATSSQNLAKMYPGWGPWN
ncbi:atypical/PIKK/ATR protein kinase [Coprinopsis marcescibilis]|uniref:non-specific serine/threonine protein kinase n=1 Tax=Coprinopsis marcescibilis TaxID=230819 RepID=A0A5C3L066_COPMA|nr:atypical/PIKK/ATR protein kinase [Coprinopsis marcescibilis]